MAGTLERSHGVTAVAAKKRIGLLRDALGPAASEVSFANSSDWYSSPTETLGAYRGVLEADIERGRSWTRIIGEPVWAGRSQAEVRAWTRYEALINFSFATAPATILCPYDARVVPPGVLKATGRTHPAVSSDGTLEPSGAYQAERIVLG